MPNLFSTVQLFATLWPVAWQCPLFLGFSRQEYWSKLLCPPPGDLPNTEIKPMSPVFLALADVFFTKMIPPLWQKVKRNSKAS